MHLRIFLLAIFAACTAHTPLRPQVEIDGPGLVPTDLYLREAWLGTAMTARDIVTGPSAVQLAEATTRSDPPVVIDNPRPKWRRTRYQGVLLARMCASEDTRALRGVGDGRGTAGAMTPDHHRILHTVLNNAGSRSFESWTEVMQFLSPHVTGSRVLSKPRQEWTSTLPATGGAQPEGWITERDGPWEAFAPHWELLRDEVVRRWVNLDIEPIEGAPIAWGNERDVERGMRIRGLVPIPCDDCVNGFLERREAVVSARDVIRGVRQ